MAAVEVQSDAARVGTVMASVISPLVKLEGVGKRFGSGARWSGFR